MNLKSLGTLSILALIAFASLTASAQNAKLGIFDSQSEVGTTLHPGSGAFDAKHGTYTVTGSGENIWLAPDAFHFVWKKVSGDFAISADVVTAASNGNPHRKAVLMIRQNLDAYSIYADVAIHGEGLTSLQFRDEKAGPTREVQAALKSPKRVRLVKRGEYLYVMAASADQPLRLAAASPRIPIQGEYYIGIGVCSHDKEAVEKATFSNVELTDRTSASTAQPVMFSILETITFASGDRKAVYITPDHIEAPNWTRDGTAYIFNSGGHLFRLPVDSTKPDLIDTGFANQCNNDHGISPDGKTLVISDQSQEEHNSLLYSLPITGGTPKRLTRNSPSYWHGWSPDGKTLAFVGERNGEFDIYTVPVEGGNETRLTTAKGLDDGPEYTPDGKYIYVNSERTGHMQIWRLKSDGSDQQQVTFGEWNDWFPHFSPDGKQMVFISFEKDVVGHPPNKDVMIRAMSLTDNKVRILTKLFGGQGTMNVPSWSPDGTRFAFVSFVWVDPADAK